ncbi:hypothetical protein [Argonema antarcticum]|nr:hypothetical protein [Argonema antarcticum]
MQVIQSLSEEDRALLESKLERQKNWREAFQRVIEVRDEINAYRGGKPLDPSPEEIIWQMREERSEELMRSCFPQFYPEES